jgi:hypothetical protein
METGAKEGM